MDPPAHLPEPASLNQPADSETNDVNGFIKKKAEEAQRSIKWNQRRYFIQKLF